MRRPSTVSPSAVSPSATGPTARRSRVRRRYLLMGAVLAVLVAFAGCGSDSGSDASSEDTPSSVAGPVTLLDPTEFEEFVASHPDAPLVNVHVPYEGHIEGTTDFVPFDEIAEWTGLPADRSAPLVIYCRSGNMSADASADLAAMGYSDVVDLRGGMQAWTASGRQLVMSEPSTTTVPG